MSQTENRFPHSLGSGWMVIATLFFAAMGVFVKLGAQYFSSTELVFWRTALGVVFLGSMAIVRKQSFKTPCWKMHVKRGLVGYVSLLMYFYAIAHLPLATAVTLNYTSPLFLALLSVFLLREKLSSRALGALMLGFIGVIVLLRPTLEGSAWYAGLMGLGSGFLAGWSYLYVRELGKQGEPEWRVVFYFTLVSTIGGMVLVSLTGWHPVTAQSIWSILGIGVTGTFAQLALTRSYKVGSKLLSANLSYLTVVFSTAMAAILWADPIHGYTIGAMLLIIISGILAKKR